MLCLCGFELYSRWVPLNTVWHCSRNSLRSMAVLLNRAQERRSREIREQSARERAAKPREK